MVASLSICGGMTVPSPNQLPAALSIAHHWRWPVWIGFHAVQITHAHLGNFATVM